MSVIKLINSSITCHHCLNSSVELCGNTTLTCNDPADTCYTVLSQGRRKVSKSCVWSAPHFVCRGMVECNLHCCSAEDLCNEANEKAEGNWVRESDAVNWLYVVVLYLILPFMLILAKMTVIPQDSSGTT